MSKINWKTIRFIIIGGSGALIYLLCSYALITYLHFQAYSASLVAYAASFIFAYLGQKIWAFRSIAPHSRTLTRYALLQFFCAAFAAVFSQLAANQGMLSTLQLSTLASILTAVISYFASSYWVFAEYSDQNHVQTSLKSQYASKWHSLFQIDPNRLILLLYFTLCVFYIQLYYYMPFSSNWNGIYDDRFFIRSALDISEGRWLGSYSQYTLMKGPGYALFLVFAHFSQLPLYLITAIFHCISITSLVWVMFRLSNSKLLAVTLFLTLLWTPLFLSNGNIIRDQIYPDQFILGFALFVYALFLAENKRKCLISGLLSGGVLGWFWLTREEGVWILPGMVFLGLFALIKTGQNNATKKQVYQSLAAVITMFCLIQFAFQFTNWVYYGKFIALDVKEKNFKAALTAIQSVREGELISHVPVSAIALERLYSVSPTFNTLKKYFTTVGKGWYDTTCQTYPWACREYTGGVFIWALREAAASEGHYRTPEETAAFFEKIADEINTACNDGRLTCQKSLIEFMPAFTDQDIHAIPETISLLIDVLLLKFHADTTLAPYSNFIAPPQLSIKILDFLHSRDRFIETDTSILQGRFQVLAANATAPETNILDARKKPLPFSIEKTTANSENALNTSKFILKTACTAECSLIITSKNGPTFQSSFNELIHRSIHINHIRIVFDQIEIVRNLSENYQRNNLITFEMRKFIAKCYQNLSPYLIGSALLAFCYHIALAIKKCEFPTLLFITGTVWLLALTRIVILFLVHISAFPALAEYFAPGYSLIMLASVLSIFLLFPKSGSEKSLFKNREPAKLITDVPANSKSPLKNR